MKSMADERPFIPAALSVANKDKSCYDMIRKIVDYSRTAQGGIRMEEKIKAILSKMTLKEKIALCSGADSWHTKAYEQYGVPAVMMTDGPHGLRKQNASSNMVNLNESVPATCFPTAVSTGCSWDKELVKQVGKAIGEEAVEYEVSLVLGPGLNIKRNPLCGRNFEYFSEDPVLAGKLAASMISGIQSQGVGACMKHFAANNQEYKRFTSDSVADERTLREIYLTGFEIAAREAKPRSIMCGYNKINGVHCSDNEWLMTKVLREDWGWDGMVVTDWGAMADRREGFKAGCDLSMPGGSDYMESETAEAVSSEKLPVKYIDRSAARVLRLVFQSQKALKNKKTFDREAHHELARQAAEGSAVLLKNEDNILPLKAGTKVALIGDMARNYRYQGAGSSHINPTKLTTLFDCMGHSIYAQGCDEKGSVTQELLQEAAQAAKNADVAVLCVGLTAEYESEGFDRAHMRLPEGHIRLINVVSEANPNTVVVLISGSAVETPWDYQVKGILYMGLSGQAGGEAAANLLWGRANPSGRLAESWPRHYSDCPSAAYYADGFKDAQYREGIYVGYRYYDKAGVSAAWPFGYGLSYTSFAYSDSKVWEEDGTVKASVVVTNTGNRDGREVVQLYITMPQDGIHRPVKELKNFAKVYIPAGKAVRVTFVPKARDFALWSEGWKVPTGEYEVLVGGRMDTLISAGTIAMDGPQLEIPQWQPGSWYEAPKGQPTQEQWEAMLGRKYVEQASKKGEYTMQNSILEMKETSKLMAGVYRALELYFASQYGGKVDYSVPEFRMMMATSADCSMSGTQICGQIKGHLMNALVEMANGNYKKAAKLMMKK